ncbi:hypothetical protein A1O3_05340 [Capronia epimyces CBS 606.96]|uniref:Rhodopsin domain-containing protein n=1 Tax=Capronia epimyces CBS 606.96 TaxID=1182542 RepID=W9Y4U4_9EURO|nr:uncharacterized protein A1O3_05340 [Capronia epimyces CBS 606.96]EXJ84670.1 hypothetical protein A1O3_05340 [Capronia epimyces CBS 606.96]
MATDDCAYCPVEHLGLGGRGAHLVIPSILAPILSCLVVANRVYWRLNLVGSLGLDDLSTILAMTFLFAQCGASIAAVNFGYGRPVDTLNQHQASQALEIFYKLTINCTKLSILFLYLRIFTDRMWFVQACRGMILFILCACLCFTAATIFQCSPLQRAWERWNSEGTCVNLYALWYSNAIYNILTDLIIVLMVPPVIFTLKLPIRQKLALTCIFGLGTIVCVASISRLTTLYSSAYGSDLTAGSLVSTIWTTVEAGLGVICANLPMLRTPLQRCFPRLFPIRPSNSHTPHTTQSQPSGVCSAGPPVAPRIYAPPYVATRGTHPDQAPQPAAPFSQRVNHISTAAQETWGASLINNTIDYSDVNYEAQDLHFFDRAVELDPSTHVDWYSSPLKVW